MLLTFRHDSPFDECGSAPTDRWMDRHINNGSTNCRNNTNLKKKAKTMKDKKSSMQQHLKRATKRMGAGEAETD